MIPNDKTKVLNIILETKYPLDKYEIAKLAGISVEQCYSILVDIAKENKNKEIRIHHSLYQKEDKTLDRKYTYITYENYFWYEHYGKKLTAMTVGQLKAYLESVPDDMLVVQNSDYGLEFKYYLHKPEVVKVKVQRPIYYDDGSMRIDDNGDETYLFIGE